MPGRASDLEEKTVGKAERWFGAKVLERSKNDVRVLNRETLVAEQKFDGCRYLDGRKFVNGGQNPSGLDEYQMGDPAAPRDELVRASGLFRIVSRDEPHEDVGINRAHAAFARSGRGPD